MSYYRRNYSHKHRSNSRNGYNNRENFERFGGQQGFDNDDFDNRNVFDNDDFDNNEAMGYNWFGQNRGNRCRNNYRRCRNQGSNWYPSWNPCPDTPATGSWSSFERITEAQNTIFQTAMANIIGVFYLPLYASTQVVNGMNYRFLTQQFNPQTGKLNGYFLITVYVDTTGNITLQTIEPYNC